MFSEEEKPVVLNVSKEQYEHALSVFLELRKEILQAQKNRAQVGGLKITLIGTAIALFFSNLDDIPTLVFVVPAFIAIFFDYLLNSYSFCIKRIGFYIRRYLEPIFSKYTDWNKDILHYENFMTKKKIKQKFSLFGNLGLTFLTFIPAIWALTIEQNRWSTISITISLSLFFTYDLYTFLRPRKIAENDFHV